MEPFGILLPFQRAATGTDFATGGGEELARSKVELVLGTRPGEVDWRPDFGCGIHQLRHQNNTVLLQAFAAYHVRAAFSKWLPTYYVPPGGLTMTPIGRALELVVRFNQRTATGAPAFPRDLTAQVQVALAPGA